MFLHHLAIFCLTFLQHSLCHDAVKPQEDPVLQFLNLDPDSPHEIVKIDFAVGLQKKTFSWPTMPAGTKMRIRAFGNNVDLWLRPRDSLLASESTPIYYGKYSPGNPGNVSIMQQFGLMRALGRIFEDPRHLASLVIGRDSYGRTTVNGRIESKNLIVRSLPESVVNEYISKSDPIDNRKNRFSDSSYHVVYKADDDFEKRNPFNAIKDSLRKRRMARSTTGVPFIIYPKILLVAESSMYSKQGRDIFGFLEYLLAFANGIDLKYRSFQFPRFRLHIAGILLGLDPGATPYISNVMLTEDAFEAGTAMLSAREFFYEIRDSIPVTSYDISLTVTRHAFGVNGHESTVGLGWIGSACRNSTLWETVDAIAMARDDGAFSGVHVAAHELGHVFGMQHDTDERSECMYNDGFIMAYMLSYTKNSSTFSSCSLEDVQNQLTQNHFECMYESPLVYDREMPKLMPGRIKGLREQCSNLGMENPCNVSAVDVCVNLHCMNDHGECTETGIAALEGTQCNDENEALEQYCIYNRCVRV